LFTAGFDAEVVGLVADVIEKFLVFEGGNEMELLQFGGLFLGSIL
jgi:hypothetical protein